MLVSTSILLYNVRQGNGTYTKCKTLGKVGEEMKWKIGNIVIDNRVVLAPMAGISNPAYMKICEEMELGYAITELISAEAIVRGNKKTLEMLNGIEELNVPVAVQIFGSVPETMAKAAKILVDKLKIKIIDINMGCPVPKVALRSAAGSALLRDTDKIYEIVKAVKEAVNIPVTVKIRSGWDEEHINACEVARICESAGASAIAVHARTRSQGYSGKANWNIIKSVVDSVNIPVIGNGDITSPELAKKMIDETGCTAIMVGRGVLGNPWLIREISAYLKDGVLMEKPTNKEKLDMIKKHYELLKKFKPEKLALLEIRSHAIWYLKGMPNSATIKNKICSSKNSKEILEIIEEYCQDL